MYMPLFLFALLPLSDQGRAEGDTSARDNKTSQVTVDSESLLATCKKMKPKEYELFVRRLGNKRDFASLAILYNPPCSSGLAASVACESMADEDAVAFCCQFEEGSRNWRAAFCCLGVHPTIAVRDYVKRSANSRDRCQVALCYDLCKRAQWDD